MVKMLVLPLQQGGNEKRWDDPAVIVTLSLNLQLTVYCYNKSKLTPHYKNLKTDTLPLPPRRLILGLRPPLTLAME